MFAYCQDAVGIPVDDFKLIADGIGHMVARRQERVGRQNLKKQGDSRVLKSVWWSLFL